MSDGTEITDPTDAGTPDDPSRSWPEEIAVTLTALHQDFERLATAVTPLLSKQFKEVEARNRTYEQRLKLRQERPLIIKMAGLLNDVRRLGSDADVRVHVDHTIETILTDLGYQPFGAIGDPYRPDAYEAIGGRMSSDATVTVVHTSGLECFGDVILRARVDIGPSGGGALDDAPRPHISSIDHHGNDTHATDRH